MTVISDTSPLSALASIDQLELFPKLFGEIVIPRQVLTECLHPKAPGELREWAFALPPWVLVHEAPEPAPADIMDLDAGETAALALACISSRPVLLVMDERKGVMAAKRLGIPLSEHSAC